MIRKVKFPQYVFFGGPGGTAMRLISIAENGQSAEYYRDAGAWSTRARYDADGVLKSYGHPNNAQWSYLNDKTLTTTTEAIWKSKNRGYV